MRQHGAQRLGKQGGAKRQPEAIAIGQDIGEDGAQQAIGEITLIGLLDMRPRMIDQMHVVHARGACGHAGQARQAAVDMLDHLFRCRLAAFQHVLDEIDTATRTVEFVAQQQIGRTGRGAEAAMNAAAQNLFRSRHMRIGQLRG